MKQLLLTPMQFYKRFGHESSRMYTQGIFLICDMFEEWRVDKGDLSEIIELAQHIKNGGIEELREIIGEHTDEDGDDYLYELDYTQDYGVYNIQEIKNMLKELVDLKKELSK